jgi:hypothetical protein
MLRPFPHSVFKGRGESESDFAWRVLTASFVAPASTRRCGSALGDPFFRGGRALKMKTATTIGAKFQTSEIEPRG